MNKRKIILSELSEQLCLGDKIILCVFKRYTYKIYRIGYYRGFNFKD